MQKKGVRSIRLSKQVYLWSGHCSSSQNINECLHHIFETTIRAKFAKTPWQSNEIWHIDALSTFNKNLAFLIALNKSEGEINSNPLYLQQIWEELQQIHGTLSGPWSPTSDVILGHREFEKLIKRDTASSSLSLSLNEEYHALTWKRRLK